MPELTNNLIMDRCPHCSVANPNLSKKHHLATKNHSGQNQRHWFVYACGSCGGVVTASSANPNEEIIEIFPEPQIVENDIPEKPKAFLEQAIASIHAPAGAVMLASSSVDSMLKLKGLTEGSLYKRIEKAAEDNLITNEMATWAHDVRLDANDQRHADKDASLPNQDDAKRAIDFTKAFAEFLFVLPAKVKRGLSKNS